MNGSRNFHSGRVAEDTVAKGYEASGHVILKRRWRGQGGEIDLIAQKGGQIVFIEVKQSGSFEKAAHSLGGRQIARLLNSAEEFLGTRPLGSLTPARFDVALVNSIGQVDVIENALGA